MKARYYIDPDTEQPHIYNHGVREQEVEFVLRPRNPKSTHCAIWPKELTAYRDNWKLITTYLIEYNNEAPVPTGERAQARGA